jgi:glutathione-regulated potassium-efflux system ancillary protein KefF
MVLSGYVSGARDLVAIRTNHSMAETTPTAAPAASGGGALVIVAHPAMEQSRTNRRLLRAASAQAGSGVTVRELYRLYPDYLIDVAAEQAALASARLVVWQHPIQWYSMPALMKLWVDEVLGFGWAYGPGGTALRGKDLWLVGSTGGPQESYRPDSYNRYFFDAFLPPYEQTAALCGMRFLPPMMLHGAHRASEQALADHARVYAERLASYPAWPELDELPECPACEVPMGARPSAGEAAVAKAA